jgi:hypothetical protein
MPRREENGRIALIQGLYAWSFGEEIEKIGRNLCSSSFVEEVFKS